MSRATIVAGAELLGVVCSVTVVVVSDPRVRTIAIVGVALALLAEGRDARLFAVSLVAYSTGGLLSWFDGWIKSPAAIVLSPALTLGWLIAMAVPAAIACDRWLRPLIARIRRLAAVPFARPIASGFFALTASLATLAITTSQPEPIRASVWLAFLTATAVATAGAVREDRRRVQSAKAGDARRD